jgi:hypothetical protein
MNFATSTAFQASALIPNRSHRAIGGNYSRIPLPKDPDDRTSLCSHTRSCGLRDSEKFYQEHETAIFMAMYAEVAFVPLVAALIIPLYRHWAM